MDVEVIDSEGGLNAGQRGSSTDDGDDDPHEVEEINEDGLMEPYVGMEFDSEDAAKSFYDEYARRIGFITRVGLYSRSSAMVTGWEFLCGRDGLKRRAGYSCKALLQIAMRGPGKWVVTRFVKEHSHSTMTPGKVKSLRPRRHFASGLKNTAEVYQGIGSVPSSIMYISMDGNHIPADENCIAKSSTSVEPILTSRSLAPESCSYRQSSQKRALGRDAQNLLDYFKKMQAENPGFYYAVQLDEDNHLANVFWADARSRTAYSHFGDVVTLDIRYRANQYRVPFAPFMGVNHHGQTILFACALLLVESEATFLWLFKTFLSAMNDHAPACLTTGKDKVIQMAASQVFPEARHCINKWDVLREGQDRMSHICHLHPNFEVELYNCINLTQTVEEFELSWDLVIDKYDLRRNDWLQSIYNIRRQWVPVYFRDSFFAAISSNQGFGSSFFDGYVSQQTTLPLFFRQYESALKNSFDKEVEADFETMQTSPILKTPSPMEKQAASLYTRKIFSKFQEELVETFVYTANTIDGDGAISTFRVAKFEDDKKAYMVSLNVQETKASCSCQMFEYSGILCRHVLTVFTVTNVLKLPARYVLKRWTRNAKTGVGSYDCGVIHSHESFTNRYNILCREAIRYAEDGALAPETYNILLNALKEAGKKIVSVKKNVAKVAPSSIQVTGVSYDDDRTLTSAPDMTPLLWPRQDETTKCLNLNQISALAQSSDLDLPRMAPISVQHGDGASDNMIILPCLKSMTWVMENKNCIPANRVAVINLKLQDYSRVLSGESEVKFHLSKVTLEPMLKSMAYISEQLSTPSNRVAIINLKLQDTEAISGESEVKFQVSKDTLGAMLRSMQYIRKQLSIPFDQKQQVLSKKQRK